MDLVPDRWYAVLDPREVPSHRPIQRRRLGRDVVFWRDGTGTIRAADDRCPHRAAALSIGTIEEGCLTCPFHGFRFDGAGRCVRIPAHPDRPISPTMSLRTIPTREAHDLVWAWTGAGAPPPGSIDFFDTEGFTWEGSQIVIDWEVHYTRSIENQLDFAHLPFVHRTTIGRFAAVEVTPKVEVEGDHLRTWVGNEGGGRIHFIGPNVWQLELGPRLFNFLAFVPVDDERMTYYVRTYQRMVTIPGLSWAFGKVQSWVNPVVLAQDARVVHSQRPRFSSLSNQEVLVPSDLPIIEYLRWRKRAQATSATG